ncbi:MAG: hypothetical protein HY074_13395 [Deltaproteobacteria bacterium]|nr:hypothetical protein [Deltaproteobacteria bacterium]
MAPTTDIIYGPPPQIRVIPAPFGISVAMMVGTFFVAHYNVNGLRDPAGYAPAVMFAVFTLVFGFLYWRGSVRITLGAADILVERLFPASGRVIARIPYPSVARVQENKTSLKLTLYSVQGRALLRIPGMASKLAGEFTASEKTKDLPASGLLRERHLLKLELLKRCNNATES